MEWAGSAAAVAAVVDGGLTHARPLRITLSDPQLRHGLRDLLVRAHKRRNPTQPASHGTEALPKRSLCLLVTPQREAVNRRALRCCPSYALPVQLAPPVTFAYASAQLRLTTPHGPGSGTLQPHSRGSPVITASGGREKESRQAAPAGAAPAPASQPASELVRPARPRRQGRGAGQACRRHAHTHAHKHTGCCVPCRTQSPRPGPPGPCAPAPQRPALCGLPGDKALGALGQVRLQG